MNRTDFPFLESGLIYFDSAATAQKPLPVLEALNAFYAHEYATVHRAIYTPSARATEKYNAARQTVADFIHAPSPSNIVFTRGTTDSINLVAQSYGSLLSPGDEILITEMEHHSNIVPWQLLSDRKQLILRIIPVNDDTSLAPITFNSKTKLLAITHMANATGTINPIKDIIEQAHAHNVPVLVDGAQAAAHLSIDVQDLDADFYAFSGHKLFGPTGIGVLYAKQKHLEVMPPIQGGGDMIQEVHLTHSTYQEPPLKFEAGTPPIAQAIGLAAAIDYIQNLTIDAISTHENALLTYATEQLSTLPGITLFGTAANKGPILAFTHDTLHPLDIATLLDLQNIAVRTGHHCAQPLLRRFGHTSTVRLSFAPFNTKEEIDRFIGVLEEALASLSKS